MHANSRTALLLMIFVFIVLHSCAFSKSLRTTETASIDEKKSYIMIFYGGRYSTDVENLVVLSLEGGRYPFEVYSSDFDYIVKKGVPAKDALEQAQRFVSHHRDYYRSIISKILDPEGTVIGYEVRPLYYPYALGLMDYLDVTYYIKDNKVIVNVNLTPEIKKLYDNSNSILCP